MRESKHRPLTYIFFSFLYSNFSYCGHFPRAQLVKQVASNLETVLLFSTMKKKVTPKSHRHSINTVKWTSPQNFANGIKGWRKKVDAQWKQWQVSEQNLCLSDFWTIAIPKSQLSKLKCEKVPFTTRHMDIQGQCSINSKLQKQNCRTSNL